MNANDVVNSFLAAVEARDLDAVAATLAEDISYENMPMAPIVGRDATLAALQRFLGPVDEVEWKVLRQMASGNAVANERVDRFHFPAGWLELPVAGFFEVNDDGKITLWRDYFDMPSYTNRLKELMSAPQP